MEISKKLVLIICITLITACNSASEEDTTQISENETAVEETSNNEGGSEENVSEAVVFDISPNVSEGNLRLNSSGLIGGSVSSIIQCGDNILVSLANDNIVLLGEDAVLAKGLDLFKSNDVLFTNLGFRSEDCGESWQQLNVSFTSNVESSDETLFALIDGDIQLSNDAGLSWTDRLTTEEDLINFVVFNNHIYYLRINDLTKVHQYSLDSKQTVEYSFQQSIYNIEHYDNNKLLLFGNSELYLKESENDVWQEINYGDYQYTYKEKVIGKKYIYAPGTIYTLDDSLELQRVRFDIGHIQDAFVADNETYYATSNGIWKYGDGLWNYISTPAMSINALVADEHKTVYSANYNYGSTVFFQRHNQLSFKHFYGFYIQELRIVEGSLYVVLIASEDSGAGKLLLSENLLDFDVVIDSIDINKMSSSPSGVLFTVEDSFNYPVNTLLLENNTTITELVPDVSEFTYNEQCRSLSYLQANESGTLSLNYIDIDALENINDPESNDLVSASFTNTLFSPELTLDSAYNIQLLQVDNELLYSQDCNLTFNRLMLSDVSAVEKAIITEDDNILFLMNNGDLIRYSDGSLTKYASGQPINDIFYNHHQTQLYVNTDTGFYLVTF